MSRKIGHLAITGAIWQQDLRGLAVLLHNQNLRPYHPLGDDIPENSRLDETTEALQSGFGFFWSHSSVMNPTKLKDRLEKLPLSYCIYRPSALPARCLIWDAPRQKRVNLTMMGGEIAMTASQAICPEQRASILSWRSHLVSRGFAIVESKHELLQAAAKGAIPSDHVSLTMQGVASAT